MAFVGTPLHRSRAESRRAIRGAIAVAQGGNFLQGFAGGAIGVMGGVLGTEVFGASDAGMAGRTAFAAAGCLGSLVTGGKCAQADVIVAISHLYNAEGGWLAGAWGARLGLAL